MPDKEQNRCVFLDRDGVLNEDLGTYLFRREDLVIPEGVKEALTLLKDAGYLLIVITNQAGIAKGLYTRDAVFEVHRLIEENTGVKFDGLYYSPYHQDVTQSLTRKPGTLMLEKAIARYNIRKEESWMIGDQIRDIKAGNNAGLKTILIGSKDPEKEAGYKAAHLLEAAKIVLSDTAERRN